jgi:hypothetical protein
LGSSGVKWVRGLPVVAESGLIVERMDRGIFRKIDCRLQDLLRIGVAFLLDINCPERAQNRREIGVMRAKGLLD